MLSRWRRRVDGSFASKGGSVRLASAMVFGALLLAITAAVPVLAAENPAPPGDVVQPLAPEDLDPSRLPSAEDVTSGIEEAERKEDERKAWLQSPEAVQERQASRLAYADLGVAEAKDLISRTFAAQLAQLNEDPIRVLSDAQLISSSEETSATIEDEGDGMVLESSLPVKTENEQGDLRKVDVSLEASAEGYETENALVDVSIPESADEPIAVGEEGIAIKLAGADDDRLARPFDDENVFAAEVLPDTDMMVSPIATGVEIFNVLRSENSPETLRFQVSMPSGAGLRDGAWGAEVVKGEETLTTIPEPVALDAQGTDVPVDLAVEGNSLVLTVEHREGDYAMPILVDPILENGENWYLDQNLDSLSYWAPTTNSGSMKLERKCIYECFYGNGRALYISAQSGTYWPNQFAHWVYSAPNIHSYVKDVTLAPYNHFDHNCPEAQYPKPHNYFGIYSVNLENWVYLSVNSANQPGNSYTLPYAGDAAIFGLGTGGASYSIPCARDLRAGGSHVWLDDWNNPWVEAVSGIPSGWIKSTTPVSATATLKDQGLGVQNAVIWGEGSGIVYDVPQQTQCSGTKRSLCYTTYSANWGDNGLTGASFREGIRPGWLGGFDATGKAAGSFEFLMKVDGTAPEVTLDGALAEETNEVGSQEVPAGQGDELTLPVYNLKIEAKDGGWASLQDYRSGVKDIEVLLDKVKQEVPWQSTPSCAANCARSETYSLKLSKLSSAGKHTLDVIVRDFAGNFRERNIEFEYFPATGMKDEYVMQYFPLPDGSGNEAEEEHPQRPELAVNVMNGNLVYRETDIDVESTAALDLEVERYYNSMLPAEENSEWGDGWTLAQTPELEPEKAGGSPVPNEAEIVDSSGVVEGGVALPTEVGASKFDPELQATVTKTAGGGYELADETGEAAGAVAFDATGQAESLQSDGYAKVDYDYEAGKLSEIEVSDPATFSADPSELEIPEQQLITQPTYASSFGSKGSADGQLQAPIDAAVDSQGNVWILDFGNHRIEKFDPSGNFLAKVGSYGSGDGQLNFPTAITIAANGDLLVVDTLNYRIERFSSSGAFISKFGSYGAANGQFQYPRGIAVDAAGNIWVSDAGQGRLQKFNSSGTFLQAVATKGSGTGQLGEPVGIDVAPSGDIWVADWQNNRISIFSAAGAFIKSLGSTGTGDGQFKGPADVDVDKLGNVWVADYNNQRVQQVDLVGQFKSKFGTSGMPVAVGADSKGHLWIPDNIANNVQQWQVPIERPAFISAFGSVGSADGKLQAPGGVALGIDGTIWVVDKTNNRIQHFDSAGNFLGKFGSAGSGDGLFNRPTAIAVDRDGDLLVTDASNNRVQKFSREGQFLSKFGTAGTGNGQFSSPEGIVADLEGNIWVTDSGNGRIQKFDEEGKFLAIIGSKGSGTGQLGKPIGIDIDPDGNLWVGDLQNNRVSVFQPNGTFVTQFGSLGSGNGQFNRPSAVEVDSRGNVWVGDLSNQRVQRFDLQGNYVGQFGSKGSGEGQFSFPTANTPMGIASDQSGAIWITDVNNSRVQRWQLGNYEAPDPEPLDLNDGDPKVEVETTGGLVSSVTGNAAGTHSYVHSGDDLMAQSGPEGESKYEYDADGRMTKVTLPNGTWGSIAYFADGRVQKVTVQPAGAPSPKTTEFEYQDAPSRRTTVLLPDAPHVTYDIGKKGDVLKWWNTAKPPTIEPLMGTLFDAKEQATISAGDYYLTARAYSPEGIASIDIIVDGNVLVDEMNCDQDPNKPGLECVNPPPVNEWVMETGGFSPGIVWVEVLVTDRIGGTAAQRFWVNIPPPPPPSIGAPVPPKFKDIKKFREEYGLEVNFPVANEIQLNERIFNLIGAWHNPSSPSGQVARASWERWGVPLRAEDVAELDYREQLYNANAARIDQWVEQTNPGSFGGYYLDHRAGGIMRIGFLGNQVEQLESLSGSLSLEGGARLQVYPVAPTVSYLSVKATAESVSNAMESNSTLSNLVVSVEFDESGLTVQVGTPDVSQVQGILNQTLGASAPVTVNYDTADGSFLSGRFRNEGRMRAGDAIFTKHFNAENLHDGNQGCTAGFGAKDKKGEVAGQPIWRLFILTAGHCTSQQSPHVYRSTDSDPLDESNWNEVGEVTRTGFHQPGPTDTDAEAIRVDDAGIVPQAIFGAGGHPVPIEPATTVKTRNRVCFSGARTQEISCGRVVGRALDWAGAGDGVPRSGYWVKFDPPAKEGDSGAPVYTIFGKSVGLISADRNNGAETYVVPLLTPPGMNPAKVPGILNDPYLRPLSLKIANY